MRAGNNDSELSPRSAFSRYRFIIAASASQAYYRRCFRFALLMRQQHFPIMSPWSGRANGVGALIDFICRLLRKRGDSPQVGSMTPLFCATVPLPTPSRWNAGSYNITPCRFITTNCRYSVDHYHHECLCTNVIGDIKCVIIQ